MTDILVRAIPLPLPRPLMEETVLGCTTDCRMPLERARELADAFSEGGWYTPTSHVSKPLYGLLIESSAFWWFWGILVVVGYVAYRFKRWQKIGI